MIYFLIALIVLVCVLLVLVVLAQDPKSGTFTTGVTGGQQFGGVQRTTDLLEKITWGLGAALLVLSLSTSFLVTRPDSEIEELDGIEAPAADPTVTPTAPSPADAPAPEGTSAPDQPASAE